jgi:phospholipid/cholesterol/gamma-HCH transport system substrate-binding protein
MTDGGGSKVLRRIAAGTALLIAVVVVAVVLLGGGSPYSVKARFQNASQLVKGNLVQVSGTTVGKVKKIKLTDDGLAEVTFTVDDAYAPLKRGTLAVVRQASLSGVANRYIDLQQGPATGASVPDGGLVPAEDTESAVDLDQLFNAFDPETRASMRSVIAGFADMTEGQTAQANEAIKYLNPVLSASSRFFNELSRNKPYLERFVMETSRLVTDVADKRENLAGIVQRFGAVSTTLAERDQPLADAVHRLPGFMRKANSTFVNLRNTLDDLDPLVRESKPVVRKLRPLLADLRPFARDAAPTFRDLSRSISRPGEANDLIELMLAQPAVRAIATGPVQANGKQRRGALPELTAALTESTPEFAFLRPYGPELTGWFDDFSTSGAYDALGGFSRSGLAFSAFSATPAGGAIVPVPPQLRDEALAAGAALNRNNRCPGALERDPGDGSTNWRPTPDFNCDPKMTPVGP